MLNKREHAEFCDSYVAFSGSIWVSWGDKTDFFILDGESACLRKRRSAILLLRKIHSSQELLETAVGAQQIGLWSNFGPDQRGVTLLERPFSHANASSISPEAT